ncbi:MAG: radical SAM family heme chaperone HemW [Flavobacteriaceae bacterium]
MAGIYLHIPFCKQACHYCDFHFSTKLSNKKEVVEALCKELKMKSNQEEIHSIYFGGGTPSILTEHELSIILKSVKKHYHVSDKVEVTLEANPDDIDQSKLEFWKSQGINRLSIGIQSFKQEDLDFMNRAHNSKEAFDSLQLARNYFDNITADLIYGTPGLTMEQWDNNIEQLLKLGIPHISAYALTVEPKTALDYFIKSGKVRPLDEKQAESQFNHLVRRLNQEGFSHYEISNFAKEPYRSQHNSSYWLGAHYVGIGPGAHSFDGEIRSWNISNNSKYIEALKEGRLSQEQEILSPKDRYNEYMMTGLRTDYGVSKKYLQENFGTQGLNQFLKDSEKYRVHGEIIETQEVFLLSHQARFKADGIASDLFWL